MQRADGLPLVDAGAVTGDVVSAGSRSVFPLSETMAVLDGGWKVEPPVYVRSDWSLKRKDFKVFHFVLRRESVRMTTLLSVPDCKAVRRLMSDNDWSISPNET